MSNTIPKKQNTESLYLDQLSYDPTAESGIMKILLQNIRLIILATLSILIGGIFAFVSLPRELNPEINIPIITVQSSLIGATPGDIEELIVEPLEDQVVSVSGITKVSATASNSSGVLVIEFNSRKDPDKALDEIKNQVDLVDLPEDATDPIVQKIDFSKIPILDFLITGSIDQISLGKIAKEIEKEIEDLRDVESAPTFGLLQEEIIVELQIEKLQQFNINPTTIIRQLENNDVNFPAGSIVINNTEYQISTNHTFTSIDDIRQQVIQVGNISIPISDIAIVRYKGKDISNTVFYETLENNFQKKNAVQFRIFKADSSSIEETVVAVSKLLEEKDKEYSQIDIITLNDENENTKKSFAEFNGNMQSTVVLVFLILFIFLGLKQALIASLSVPFTFFVTFIIMQSLGFSLSFLSLFSLLLALGLVVDDAIVIVESFSSYYRSGKFTPFQAGVMVFRDFKVPIWITTITTIWAFVPLLLSSGIIGEFIKTIPIVVTIALLSSTTIATLLNLPLTVMLQSVGIARRVKVIFLSILMSIILGGISYAIFLDKIILDRNSQSGLIPSWHITIKIITIILFAILLFVIIKSRFVAKRIFSHGKIDHGRFQKTEQKSKFEKIVNEGFISFEIITLKYKKVLTAILDSTLYMTLVIVGTFIFMGVSIFLLTNGYVKGTFFPADDIDNIYVNFKGPSGWEKTEIEESVNTATLLVWENIPETSAITTIFGSQISMDGGTSQGDNTAHIIINLPDKSERERTSEEIANEIKPIMEENLTIENTVLTIGGGGPPASADIQINLFGEDLDVLENLASQFMNVIEENPNTSAVTSSLEQSPGQVQISLLPHELSKRGLSVLEVSIWLRTLLDGDNIGEIGTGLSEVDIIVKPSENTTLDQIQNLQLPSTMGSYSLREISNVQLEANPLTITREGQERRITVTASADNVDPTQLNSELNPKFENIEIPDGYSWTIGGVNEENQESVQSIIQAMGLSFSLILITIVLQLNSFRKALLVLSIIPLAICGVFLNFAVFRLELSFPSLIGVLALFGIVVNNSIMLVQKINQNHGIGLGFLDGIIDGCASRLQAITFTTLTTIFGLLPITLSDPIWRGLGGAIIAGLSVSGILILFFLPIAYKILYRTIENTFDKLLKKMKVYPLSTSS